MPEWIQSIWNRLAPIRKFFNKVGDTLASWGIFFGILGLIFFALVIGCISITQVTMIFHATPQLKELSDSILSTIGLDTNLITNNEYVVVIYSILSILIVLATIWFAIVAILSNIKYRTEMNRRSLVHKSRVYRTGVDDLQVMLSHYKNAEDVIVFSGDFSWLNVNPKLRVEIERLADERKIIFVSYKSEPTVRGAIGNDNLYKRLVKNAPFKFDSGIVLKCSLIQKRGNPLFIYQYDQTPQGGSINMCIIRYNYEGQYLLEILRHLTNPFR